MKPLSLRGMMISALVLFGISISTGAAAFAIQSENKGADIEANAVYSPSTTYTNGDSATYYSGISSSATGSTLLSSLQSLNSSKRSKTIGYDTMGTSSSSSPYIYTDFDPNSSTSTDSNGQKYGTTLASFYTKTAVTSYNKEHAWPKSRGGGNVEADIHMPRPTIESENSNRGNSFYVEGVATSSNGWDPYTAGYSESVRGEAARIIFYCMVASSSLSLSDETTIASGDTGYTTTMGKISDMLKWNLEYPVSTYETNRNEGAEYLQGNRNPFVDHPEYACRIWSSFNSNTATVCSTTSTLSLQVNGASAGSSQTMATSSSLTFTALLNGTATSAVTWSSSNTSVASVSTSGVVTSTSTAGTTTLTCTSTADSSVTATCTITVTTPVAATGVSVSPTSVSITVGGSTTLTATVTPTTATNKTVTWSSASTSTATVNASTGVVTGVAAGTAVITATTADGGYTATSTVTVTASSSSNYELYSGSLVEGDYVVTYTTSSDTGAIKNTITSNRLDYTTVTVTSGVVSNPDASIIWHIAPSGDYWTIYNSTLASYASGNGTKNQAQLLTTSSDYSLWTVTGTSTYDFTNKGNTTAGVNATLRRNTTYGFACYSTSTGGALTLYKSVSSGTVNVTGVTVTPTTATTYVGSTVALTATVSPSNATDKSVTWSSASTSTATVDSSTGVVTGVAAGSVVITATTTDGGYTATSTVTVYTDPSTSARDWAQLFLDGTATECSNLNVTSSTWTYYADLFNILTDGEKDYVYNNRLNTSETAIYGACQRYMVIITKYTTYSHFIVNSSGDIYEAPYINSNLDDAERYNGNALLSISIVCGIGVFALTAGVILTTCKKKKED